MASETQGHWGMHKEKGVPRRQLSRVSKARGFERQESGARAPGREPSTSQLASLLLGVQAT